MKSTLVGTEGEIPDSMAFASCEKNMEENESVMKVKKVQGAVGLYSQGTNPACDVMEVSVRMEHFR